VHWGLHWGLFPLHAFRLARSDFGSRSHPLLVLP
jgi:hypothetical protein